MPPPLTTTSNVRSITQKRTMVYIKIGGGETVWLNPPYGREIALWVKKAYEESQKPKTKCVLFLPARTDTKWFHDYCMKGICIFIKGRVKFGNSKVNAPFPSVVVIFE